ncbi:S8 family serine peptidase [Polaribacter sargassicola]|uniref:S8 family serine peptidase n=1 Tax=Polaribacter sargassicola TaxID=2836891 RepID=UPI001F01F8CB|nr:S8 family serine peptidase [Polaribacter sp. DS7-9]MCG1035108.1 S8 family serine peptidase [Polaribacter sp. DS7-9]
MKHNYLKKLSLILFFISFSIVGQKTSEKQIIIKDYDLVKLQKLKENFSSNFLLEKDNAILIAKQKGWKISYIDSDGSYYELMKVSKDGKPLYYKTDNADAAISTRANFLHKDGGLGLDIEGQGMTAYVWDGGLARTTHQEYDGDGGEDRFSIGDGTTELNFHAAHVMGTIIASGFEPQAKGMAPQAKGIGSDWNNDLSEATAAAAEGMLLSNHSYGYDADAVSDWTFGAYGADAREWDELLYNAPYYLKVASAGNDGDNNTANADPLNGNSLFDKLNGDKVSKNTLVVANGQDASINADGSLASVVRNSSSSEGPTDDFRIKPDIMGNGTGVYSTYESADDEYASITGTSMAAPNVTGSLLLLQQYYNETYGSFMKAATLKGLAMHTADDADMVGPDALTGWGLMNTKVAAETITKKGFESWISEETLTNGGTYSLTVKSDGFNPLLASISWTDKPGVANTGISNDPTAALVNDLDIRITQGENEYMPWKLTGLETNDKGDNLVDPFERVDVADASGEYTITITHKGTLEEAQNFSLIVTGISGEFNFLTDNSEQKVCSDSDAVFNFEFRQAVAGTTQFTSSGSHENMSVVFSENSLSEEGSFNVTFDGLEDVPAGSYDIDIIGDNGNETQTRQITLVVYREDFSDNPSSLEFPANGEKSISRRVALEWEENLNAETYLVEFSDSASFSNILFTDEVIATTVTVDDLETNTVYYWRIKPINRCGEGDYSVASSFQTGITDCSNTYEATDFSAASLNPFTAPNTAYVPINVTDNLYVNKVIVTLDINHTSVQDLTISLESPSGASVVLLSNACDDTDNISNVTFDDDADELVCSTTDPAISGTIAPENNMTDPFLGENAYGEWKLIVVDNAESNGGAINSASVTICSTIENTSIPSFSSSNIVLNGNSNYVITTSNMSASTASETDAEQIYTLVELTDIGFLTKEGTDLVLGDTFTQADVAAGIIAFTNSEVNSFTDAFKVDVTNAAKGWLPNQTITIEESTLAVDQFSLNEVSLWPNPVKGILNVQLNNTNGDDVIISLFDLQGRKIINSVYKSSGSVFNKEISTQNISSGVYLLSIQEGNKKATKKIIISK